MKTIKAKPNQTVFDLCIEQYGTCEALKELLTHNPHIRNQKEVIHSASVGSEVRISEGETPNPGDTEENSGAELPFNYEYLFQIDLAVETECLLQIDEQSKYYLRNVVKKIETDITTFDL